MLALLLAGCQRATAPAAAPTPAATPQPKSAPVMDLSFAASPLSLRRGPAAPEEEQEAAPGSRPHDPSQRLDPRRLPAGRVEGRVVDAAGSPVEGAEVGWSLDCGGTDGRTRTDHDGRFTLDGVNCRVQGLGIDRPERVRTDWAPVQLAKDGDVARVDVRLPPDADLGLTLTGFHGPGELGASLLFLEPFDAADWTAGVPLLWVGALPTGCVVDAGGRAELRGLQVGRYRLFVLLDPIDVEEDDQERSLGRLWGEADVDLHEGGNELTLAVVPVSRVAGRVVDPQGRPVEGVTVRLLGADARLAHLDHDEGLGRDGAEARTAEDGTFELVGPPGPWRVVANHESGGHARADVAWRATPGRAAMGDLSLAVPRRCAVRCRPPLELGRDLRGLLGPGDPHGAVEGQARGDPGELPLEVGPPGDEEHGQVEGR